MTPEAANTRILLEALYKEREPLPMSPKRYEPASTTPVKLKSPEPPMIESAPKVIVPESVEEPVELMSPPVLAGPLLEIVIALLIERPATSKVAPD